MKFNDRLRELRDKAGLTQVQLAERAGIPIGSVRAHEQGQRIPSWGSVVALARALGVDCTAFADCEEVQPEPAPARQEQKQQCRRPRSEGEAEERGVSGWRPNQEKCHPKTSGLRLLYSKSLF